MVVSLFLQRQLPRLAPSTPAFSSSLLLGTFPARSIRTVMSTTIPKAYAPIAKGITLYTLGTPNGVKISVALSVLGVPYKSYLIDISTNIQKEPWFLEHVNPNGRIPGIIDTTEGKPVRVFESGAILLYLADKYDKNHKISYPHGTREYYETLEWLFFQNAGVGPMQGQANHFKIFASEKIPYGIKRYTDETRRLYSVLETRLKQNKSGFLVGDHVSIADFSTVGWVGSSYGIDIDLKSEFPELHAWVERIIKLPGAVEGFNTPNPWRGFTTGPWKAQ
jgi:glutathione S-transferase